ncbi:MAG TPA: MBL fold metallo-hydrolase [Paenalcaligenes sp.]|nr:MBL fold metallo-hydrolase [Paenalcaligenes sp.]
MDKIQVIPFLDSYTSTYSYIVHSPTEAECAVIDSVLDYEPNAARISTTSAEKIVDYIKKHNLKLQWILETHAHADHLSASAWLKEQLGGQTAIGAPITTVQSTFKKIYNLGNEVQIDGRPFDRLLNAGERFFIGTIPVDVLHVPGHTPADMAYHVHGAGVFVGDTLFQPDVGTARCDFPGGDAKTLYQSIQKIYQFPDDTVLYMCHDYPPQHRKPSPKSTVGAQKWHNIHVREGISQEEFVSVREKRDATLAMPRLLLPSLQVNIRAGELPEPENNQTRYLKIPLNML